ncbi:hypothetical protein IQ07DRAFT_593303 [Pyrenochaeta sp. DS3sAY3a]|nr:hypothetical protein IQ07DRAFT_593303 [Pyrenochaeta sp. DS3sAY3a]
MAQEYYSEAEWNGFQSLFPNSGNRTGVMKLAGPDPRYNCIAWALGRTELWIDPPAEPAYFRALFLSPLFKLKECQADQALVDGFYKDDTGVCTHGSRLVQGNRWTSKLGQGFLISHPREALNDYSKQHRSLYGDNVFHFCPDPNAMDIVSMPSPPLALQQSQFLLLLTFMASIQMAFPRYWQHFDANWKSWALVYRQPGGITASSSSDFARGPAWDALISMGTRILPLVVEKIVKESELFACQLYNALQTAPDKKLSPQNNEHFYILNWQIVWIANLYRSQFDEFEKAAQAWRVDQQVAMYSSTAVSYVSGKNYQALVNMGKAIIPFIMGRYCQDQHGWWYELLNEIMTGAKYGLAIINKEALYQAWANWFEYGGDEPPRIESSASGAMFACVIQAGAHRQKVRIPLAT